MNCNKCESLDTIRFGFNHTKKGEIQKYKCCTCKNIFCSSDKLPHNHVSSEIVGLCIDLYLKGLSYRVIQRQLWEQFKIKPSHTSIYLWVQKYAKIMKNFVDTLSPKVSVVWQLDETVIDFKGVLKLGGNFHRKCNWCWAGIDTGTRYVLDMYLAIAKDGNDACKFFRRMKNSVDIIPEVITTDRNPSYIRAIREVYPDAKHSIIKMISIKPNTSFIERYNGTIKNRTKTMRGFDSFHPCQTTLTMFQIYYNFFRPHMALGGQTPAQKAGIHLEFPERWVSMIRYAMTQSTEREVST